MQGFDSRRLALIVATRSDEAGEVHDLGTGYFLTANVLATANHVLADQGLRHVEVRTEADGVWRTAQLPPLWRDPLLDVALIRVIDGLGQVDEMAWIEEPITTDVDWQSSGYPVAAQVRQPGRPPWSKTAGLRGILYARGGGGQGSAELELTVEAPPPAASWAGISGAPIFVADRLAGFIKEVPASFKGGRLAGTPAASLLQSHGFRVALSEPWMESVPNKPWILVVLAETKTDLAEWVDGMLQLENDRGTLQATLRAAVEQKSITVNILDALQSPGHWLKFVRLLCIAPIAIFDATGFEPAVMVALGVRAVVRRGITITSTAKALAPSTLSGLPFNIQETKVVHHGSDHPITDARHPHNMLAAAIRKGWQDMRSGSRYLDLPAYDAVRCPFPGISKAEPTAVDRVLILCSFRKEYETNWLYLSNALALHYPSRPPVRMLDIASPRLVGQALYESIRWARTCIVDWTEWRANVFFELGVRLGCAEIGPVNVMDQQAAAVISNTGAPAQHALLLKLFRVTLYDINQNATIRMAFRSHDDTVHQVPTRVSLDTIPHDATYIHCVDCFDWSHERMTASPHEMLRRSVQEPFGPDRQALGRSPILFSNNAGFSKELERSIRERWIAAWYYLHQRHARQQWSEDSQLRAELRKLGNEVLQFALRGTDESHLIELRDSIYEILDELKDLDKR
jgi:hypothetical protein